MSKVKVGQAVPDMELHATDDQVIRLSELRGNTVVLYFYPKDNTPGCTTEGQDFRDHYDEFDALDTIILGVSKDSLHSHEQFKSKESFPFDLISDPDEKLCHAFDVIREKTLYGKKFMGIERSTFVIDEHGILREEFRKVKVNGHVPAVLAAVKQLHDKRG
jgi:peroxiredoxin Q/BCP